PALLLYEPIALGAGAVESGTYAGMSFRLQMYTLDNQLIASVQAPITLILNYQPDQLAALGWDARDLNLAYNVDGQWKRLLPQPNGGVDTEQHQLTARTERLTDFALIVYKTRRRYIPSVISRFSATP
ncbi:MAG: hypothetical protein J7M34_08295, partial [Anaerolineae bacterium]|nr:hypothetical protein [Anaerolineae bacterium]